MNKRLFKKVLTAVITAAMLFTSNGLASLNASAAEKVYVEGVYTNFQRATMAIETSRQINAYVEPSNATVQRLQYKSSAPEVASVSNTGLISALSPGKATITVTALDGSYQIETIVITVLEDLIITKDLVDSDNEVIVLDKTLGNLYIDSSVGDADIYIGGVTVRNILGMDSGEYSLFLYDTMVKELKIEDIPGEIESFATDEKDLEAPSLIIGENTEISDLNARISAKIRQEDGSAIEGLRITQTEDGKVTVYLEGYSGGLLLDASLGDVEIVASGCSLTSVNVSGDEDAGNVILTDGGDSGIENLTLNGAAKVNLGLPANEVNIDRNAKGVIFNSTGKIGLLRNAGSSSKISLSASVDNFDSNGSEALVYVGAGGYIGIANLNGAGTSLSGDGEVSEAYVNANNISIDTVNTLITVGDVTGTKAQGKDVSGGTTVATVPIFVSGGGIALPPPPEEPIEVGEIIIDNDFEDGRTDLRSIQGSSNISVVDSGDPDRGKVAYISGKQADWAGAGVDLHRYLGKYITIEVSTWIKAEGAGEVKATIKYNGDQFTQIEGGKIEAPANTWTEIKGRYLLDSTITSAIIYFEGTGNYYLDDVLITVASIGEPIPAETVSIDQTEITINRNESKRLIATVTPSNADIRTVTWSSSDTLVATVDQTGLVTGIKAGTVTITATSDCTYAEEAPVATAEVEVMDVVVINLNKNYVFFTSVGDTDTLDAGEDATWTSSDEAVATVSETGLVTAVGNGTATITATIPGGIGTCTVKVDLQPEGTIVIDFDNKTAGTSMNMKGAGKATIVNDPTVVGSTNKVLLLETVYGYSEFAYFEITLPEGKKLGDYVSLLAKLHLVEGDVGHKNLRVWAGETLADITVDYNPTASQIGVSENKSGNAIFEPVTAEFTTMSASLRNLTGTIVLGLGIMADPDTTYALDEIILVPFTGDPVAITDLTLNKDTLTLVEGRSETLEATIVPDDATTNREITWTSSDNTVATVDPSGKVTAIKAGTATITAKSAIDGVSVITHRAECIITVDPKPDYPTDEVIFETGFEDDDPLIDADGGDPTIVDTVSYEGTRSLRVTGTDSWHGPQYTLTNSSDSLVTYEVSSYVRKEGDDAASIRYVENGGDYTTYNTIVLTTDWQLFTAEITLGAGESLMFRLAPIDGIDGTYVYYVDNYKITKPAEEITIPDPEPTDREVVFKTGFEDGDPLIEADGGDPTIVDTVSYEGTRSLRITGTDSWHGPQYTLINSSDSSVTYEVSSYVRKEGDDAASVRYVENGGDYTTYNTVVLTTDWQLFTAEITLGAGESLMFRLAPIDGIDGTYVYYVDNYKITKPNEVPVVNEKYFTEFFIAENKDYAGANEEYINSTNFSGIASDGGVTGDTLSKFESWNGIKEVVKGYEITIDIINAVATTGEAISVEILVQNEPWSVGSYKQFTIDSELVEVSASDPILTLKKTILFSDVIWSEEDTMTGKIQITLKNIKEGTAPEAKYTIKVLSNNK